MKLYNGDCLEVMNKKIIDMYLSGTSMRKIALTFNTNHKKISRILHKNSIPIREPSNNRCKRKFDSDIERQYNNMASHLRFNVGFKWLMQFEDFEKLKFLNNAISDRDGRYNENTEWYKSYINKFYFDEQFNNIYYKWLNNKDLYMKPSIDHIIPKSKGGDNCISNLQFVTWFENRCKNNLTQEQWNTMKSNIGDYLI